MPRARVAHEALLLGNDEQVVVLEAHVERDVGVGGKKPARIGRGIFDLGLDAIAEQHLLGL